MKTVLRDARPEELAALSDLCLRSKAFWGYGAAFMDACREELMVRHQDLDRTRVAEVAGAARGVAQVSADGGELMLLYVDPGAMGLGLGRALLKDAADRARAAGVRTLRIEADPNAAPFYQRLGAVVVGTAPSGSIPGRSLPLLELPL